MEMCSKQLHVTKTKDRVNVLDFRLLFRGNDKSIRSASVTEVVSSVLRVVTILILGLLCRDLAPVFPSLATGLTVYNNPVIFLMLGFP